MKFQEWLSCRENQINTNLDESFAAIAGTAIMGIIQNYLQDKGINVPELPTMDVDSIMNSFDITYEMILNYLLLKNTLTPQEIQVLKYWCLNLEDMDAIKKKINICKACQKLCKIKYKDGNDYCQEYKAVKKRKPEICRIQFNPDYDKEFKRINQPSKMKLAPVWYH